MEAQQQQQPQEEIKETKSTAVQSSEAFLQVQFGQITDKNIEQLKLLNIQVIPVRYSHQFYQQIYMLYTKYSKLVFFNDIMIGGIVCREEMRENEKTIYILTIGVLKPYRRYKIGQQMLLNLEKQIKEQNPDVQAIYLHVWVANQEAIKFYQKYGYDIKETIKDYYQDIEPKDCYLVRKGLTN